MNYSYEILKIEPRHKILTVRYFKEGKDDFFKNFNPTSFEEADIVSIIQEFFPAVKRHWEYQDTVDEDASTLEEGSTGSLTYAEPESVVQTQQEKALQARGLRDAMLSETDWRVLSDSSSPSQAWLDYRQALRDVPSQAEFPDNIVWPTKPA